MGNAMGRAILHETSCGGLSVRFGGGLWIGTRAAHLILALTGTRLALYNDAHYNSCGEHLHCIVTSHSARALVIQTEIQIKLL